MPGVRTQPVFKTPIVMPRAAASRALPSLPTGVQTGGCGCWYGRGQTLTERYWKCVPSQLNGPSCEVIAFRIRSCASQKRSTRSAGLVLAGEISNGTPLTKPMSSRPREITSIIEYSSATRIGSLRLPIGMPSASRRTFLVSRARIAIGIVQTDSAQVAVAWCSLVMMLMPSSSHSAHSSR